uniref:Uncharacterized protein n=1 Tax=Zea mays TaxID=4577 RepID=B6TD96_MAIZE|nr:hypothetical protein [Zea mays]
MAAGARRLALKLLPCARRQPASSPARRRFTPVRALSSAFPSPAPIFSAEPLRGRVPAKLRLGSVFSSPCARSPSSWPLPARAKIFFPADSAVCFPARRAPLLSVGARCARRPPMALDAPLLAAPWSLRARSCPFRRVLFFSP